MNQNNIRNFCIISHIDHGKSTLADRFLELTETVEKRKMKEQFLDQMELEREKGITIKLQPVRMIYQSSRTNADYTRTDADGDADERGQQSRTNADNGLLYEDLSYKIRGAAFNVKKKIGLGHKEIIYQKALEEEFKKLGLIFEKEKVIDVKYDDKKIGIYRPDFVFENKVIVEIKALPFIGKKEEAQMWTYLKGSDYKLLLLINFSSDDVYFKRIVYDSARCPRESVLSPRKSAEYVLNLIDTPGHVDFTYEVSRSLQAVEGAILLVDATKGIQAQTLANLHLAIEQNLVIIPAVNKIDLENARVEEVEKEIKELFTSFQSIKIPPTFPLPPSGWLPIGGQKGETTPSFDKGGVGWIYKISAKTGEGVEELLRAVIEKVPPPKGEINKSLRALVFDSVYDSYKGVLAYIRIIDGEIKKNEQILLMVSGAKSEAIEVGVLKPNLVGIEKLSAGEIGYIATGLKEVGLCRVGDTITNADQRGRNADERGKIIPLPGYKEPKPMLFASFYPTNEKDFEFLKDALSKLKSNDAALIFEAESSALGRGYKCGFLGMLHLEIISERLKREFDLNLVITTPSLTYKLTNRTGEETTIYSAHQMPEPHLIQEMKELWVRMEIVAPSQFLGKVMQLLECLEGAYKETRYLTTERLIIEYEVPLREIIVDFYDKLKSVTSGYASMSYEFLDWRLADLVKLDILIAGEIEEAFSKIVSRARAQAEGRAITERLKEAIPPQMFAVAVQAAIGGSPQSGGAGKIIARETIRAYKKDVTGHLYGGDYTRKKKLLEKQKRGKKKMKETGRVNIPQDVYLAVLKK